MSGATDDNLPDRFGPMTVKELRQGLRRSMFVIPFLAIQALAAAAMAAEFGRDAGGRFSEYVGVMNVVLLFVSGPFWMVVSAVCAVVMPLGGLALMGQEMEEGNHELLLLTRLNRWSVVRGKFLMLWGLCALTFFSLLPYVVVRYFIGGIELPREVACSLTVLGLSAMISAGMIGASAFRGLGARIGMILLFLFSMVGACAVPLAASAGVTGGCGVFFHINAAAAVFCYTTLGLSLARSRLRLAVHAYELKPGWMMGGLLVFTPFVVWMTTAMTIGYGGFAGLVGMGIVALYADATPKMR
jgi:ABC-type transport system involved in multi-copper enzyme maturation permease subunit